LAILNFEEMNKPEMPKVLKALCMLSFLGSGGGFLLYLTAAIFYEKTQQIVLEYSSMHSTEQISPLYFLLFSVLFGVSFWGVSLMWKLKKAGFFVYSAAQIAIFSLPLLWIGKEAFSSVVLIFTAMFIVAYATQYRKLTG
jgi:hypothetical protein